MMVLFNANVDSLGHVALAMEEACQDDWPEGCCVESVYSGFKTVIEGYLTWGSAYKQSTSLIGMMEDPEPLPVARLRDFATTVRSSRTLVDESEGEDEDEDEVEADDEEPVEDDEVLGGRGRREEKPRGTAEKNASRIWLLTRTISTLGHLPNFDAHRQQRVNDAEDVNRRNRRRNPSAANGRRQRLKRRKAQRRAAERRKQRRERRSGADCPEEFRSPLTGAS